MTVKSITLVSSPEQLITSSERLITSFVEICLRLQDIEGRGAFDNLGVVSLLITELMLSCSGVEKGNNTGSGGLEEVDAILLRTEVVQHYLGVVIEHGDLDGVDAILCMTERVQHCLGVHERWVTFDKPLTYFLISSIIFNVL